MKRLFLILFSLLMLTACGKEELPIVETETLPTPVQTQPAKETPMPVPEDEEEPIAAQEQADPVSYTVQTVEGLVEDTVGYIFEIPVFGLPGGDAIVTYYEDLAAHLVDYTRETVYPQAAERGCIVSVYGEVVSATGEGGVVTVEYAFRCDYSDAEETEETLRTDLFDVISGERVG